MSAALSHLSVVELCDGVPGAACGRQFAAWGAHVTAFEPPAGCPLRRHAPLVRTSGGEETSLLWEYLAAGKQMITLAGVDPEPAAPLRQALVEADVLVTDWPAAW